MNCPVCDAPERPKRPPTIAEIASSFCWLHNLSLDDLRGPGRGFLVSHPRQQFMAEAVQVHRKSLSAVARFLHRDHTTVLHGVRSHNARIAGLRQEVRAA